jgi:hypothetical protein
MLGDIISFLIGASVFVGLMYFATKSYALRWRLMAGRYGSSTGSSVLARKTPETIVITKSGANGSVIAGNFSYTLYSWSSLQVHENGLGFSTIFPVSLICPPFFLPFNQMKLEAAKWDLWSKPIAITMNGLPEHVVIFHGNTIEWISNHVPWPIADSQI